MTAEEHFIETLQHMKSEVDYPKFDKEDMCDFAESYHQAKSRWIPVEERLPEKDQRVLGLNVEYNFYEVVYWIPKITENDFTHWQPLPEPPTQ